MASSIAIRGKITAKEIEKGRYQERIVAVSIVQADIPVVSEEYVTKINEKIDKASEKMEDAVKGISHIDTFRAAMVEKKEKSGLSDLVLSYASSQLTNEISDCNRKIEEIEEEIKELWTQYYQAVEEEKATLKEIAKAFS